MTDVYTTLDEVPGLTWCVTRIGALVMADEENDAEYRAAWNEMEQLVTRLRATVVSLMEREAYWKKRWEAAMERADENLTLRAERDALREDAARLDWLSEQPTMDDDFRGKERIRTSIDYARGVGSKRSGRETKGGGQ